MGFRKILSRLTAGALAIIMGASAVFPASADAATLSFDKGGAANWPTTTMQVSDSVRSALNGIPGTHLYYNPVSLQRFKISTSDTYGFCVRPGASANSGSIGNNLTYWNSVDPNFKTAIGNAMYYGYPSGNKSMAYCAATQIIIWEIALGIRENTGEFQVKDAAAKYGFSKDLGYCEYFSFNNTYVGSGDKTKEVRAAYKDISAKLKAHYTVPSRMFDFRQDNTKYNEGKTNIIDYNFGSNAWTTGFNIGAGWIEDNEKSFSTSDIESAIKKTINSGNWHGSPTVSISKNSSSNAYEVHIKASERPFQAKETNGTSQKVEYTDLISAKLGNNTAGSWLVYAATANSQSIVTGAPQDRPRGSINFVTPEYQNLRIVKTFYDSSNKALGGTTLTNYIKDVKFRVYTTVDGKPYYVVATGNASTGYKFKDFTTTASSATSFSISTVTSAGTRAYVDIEDLPAEANGSRSYIVLEQLPSSSAAVKAGFPAKTWNKVSTVKIKGYSTADPDKDLGRVNAEVKNTQTEDVDILLEKLVTNANDDDADASMIAKVNSAATFIMYIVDGSTIKYVTKDGLTENSKTVDGKTLAATNGHSGNYTLKNGGSLNTDMSKALILHLNNSTDSSYYNKIYVNNLPAGKHVGFIELRTAEGFGFDNEYYDESHAIPISSFKGIYNGAASAAEVEWLIKWDGSNNPFLNGPPYEYLPAVSAKTSAGNTSYVFISNKQGYVNLRVVKNDKNGRPLAGATFGLFKDKTSTTPLETAVSDANGNVDFEYRLPLHTTIYFEELEAPKGYIRDTTRYSYINHDGSLTSGGLIIINPKFGSQEYSKAIVNGSYEGELVLQKADGDSMMRLGGVQFEIKTDQALTAAEMANVKVANGGGTIAVKSYTAGESLGTFTTDSTGTIHITGLPIGTVDSYGNYSYTYSATEKPIGEPYIADNTTYVFSFMSSSLGSASTSTTIVSSKLITNYIQTGAIEIHKTGTNGVDLAGAEFQITALEDVVAKGVTIQKKGTVVGTLTTDANGRAANYTESYMNGETVRSYKFKLYPGFKYQIVETKAPDTYIVDPTPHEFTLDYVDNALYSTTYQYNATNKQSATIAVYKADADNLGGTLTGAKFAVYNDVNGNGTYESGTDTLYKEIPEVSTGVYKLSYVTDGKYLVHEEKAPVGYIKDDTYYPITVNGDGKEYVVTNKTGTSVADGKFVNVAKKGSISLLKYDEEYPDNKLSGAEFTVYADTNGNGTYDAGTDTVVGTMTEASVGEYKMSDLRIGTYFVKETKAPDGFKLDNNAYKAVITEDGQNVVIENEAGVGFTNAPKKGSIHLKKVDIEHPEVVLSGAVFEVYKDNNGNGQIDSGDDLVGTMTETSAGSGEYKISDLRMGTYLVKETTAPAGFTPDRNVYKVVLSTDGETYELTNNENGYFAEEAIKGKIKIIKVDDELNDLKLSGAVFEAFADTNNNGTFDEGDVSAAKSSEIAEGEYLIEGLRVGTYFVKEITPPEGYRLDTGVYTVVIASEGDEITIENKAGSGYFVEHSHRGTITLTKVDEEYPDNKLSGAEFTVYADTNGNGTYDAGTDQAIGILPEVETGVYTMNELRLGTYFVAETKAPFGFIADTNMYTAVLDADGITVAIENEAGVGFTNAPAKGTITLTKVDEEYPENKLAGAEFEVYADTNGNGEYDTDDELVGTLGESETGIYNISGLRLGTYFVHEVKAPNGFVLDNNYYKAVIVDQDQPVVVENQAGVGFINTPAKGTITLTKVDAEYPDNKLTGAEFTVYKDTNGNGEYDSEDEIIGTLTETEVGIYNMSDLRVGTYFVAETKAPYGFIADENVYTAVIDADGVTVVVENEAGVGFINTPDKGGIKITKRDVTTSETLPNTGIRIYDENKEVVAEGYTDENGEIIFDELRVGKYYFQEFDAPDGYLIDESLFEFEITGGGIIHEAEMTDVAKTGTITLTKVDEDYPDNKLTGAEFEVYEDTNGNGKYDEEDKLIGKLTESEVGVYTMTDLGLGTYFVHEVKAPEGFRLDNGYYKAVITDVEIVNVENKAGVGFINTPCTGSVEITKTDLTTSETLPNTGIRIYDEDKNVIFEGYTDENGKITFEGLRFGKYYFQEFDAPEGYLINNELFEFEITEDGMVHKAEMTDERIPKTGVDFDFSIPAMVGTASLLGLLGLAFIAKKKED